MCRVEELVAQDEQELGVKRAKKLAKALAKHNAHSRHEHLKRAVRYSPRCLSPHSEER